MVVFSRRDELAFHGFHGPSKRREVETSVWSSSELPSFPILLNKKAIKTHTQLFTHLPDKKPAAKLDRKAATNKKATKEHTAPFTHLPGKKPAAK